MPRKNGWSDRYRMTRKRRKRLADEGSVQASKLAIRRQKTIRRKEQGC